MDPFKQPSMPLYLHNTSRLNLCIIRTVHQMIKSKLFQLAQTLSNTQNPSLHITSILQKCKNKYHLLNQVHAHMIISGSIHYPPLASKLVDSFASIPRPFTAAIARSIADQINGLDSYTWNTIIRCYLEGNDPENAVLVYSNVRRKGLEVDSYTLLFVVKACARMPLIDVVEQVHAQIWKLGFLSEIIILTALLHVYGLFHRPDYMQQVFDEMPSRDLVTWNLSVVAYAQQKCPNKALAIVRSMVSDDVKPNEMTVVSILSACSSLKESREGKVVHGYAIRSLYSLDVFVHNALIAMYSNCGNLLYASLIFQVMAIRNVVSWTSMINAYTNNNHPNKALALFREMEYKNIKPDEITLLGVISICSKLGSFELGEWIDRYVENIGFSREGIYIANALIDMHARCGNMKRACQIFDAMVERTLVSWTSIINGLALHGQGLSALFRFCQMQREGFKPDGVAFLSVLSGCSHSGLVSEGRACFDSMIKDYGIKPWMQHYGCIVDLLCRAGQVSEAYEFIVNMPIEPDKIIWRVLLGACQSQGNIKLAIQVMNDLRTRNSDNYVLFSNLYATFAEWDAVKEVRDEMRVRGVIKQPPGWSAIEVDQSAQWTS